VAGFGCLQEGVRRPRVGFRSFTRRIHRLNIDTGVFLHQVDARAGPLDLAADTSRNTQPFAVGNAQIFDRTVDVTVLLMIASTTSLTGSRFSACACGNHVDSAIMSCPDFACASACVVSSSLLPWLGM